MLYCYLTDTALSPFLTNETTKIDKTLANYTEKTGFQYSTVDSRWLGGVGQLNERVVSMFNTEYIKQITDKQGNIVYQQYPNVVMDPRIAANGNTSTTQQEYLTNRLLGMFNTTTQYATDTSTERAIGEMQLHYDAYLASTDENVKGNFIAALENNAETNKQFAQVFNIIEYCIMAHVYNSRDRKWIFKDSVAVNEYLSANPGLFGNGDESSPVCGYIYNSVTMPLVDMQNNKVARVRNYNTETTDGVIKTTIGTTPGLYGASDPILFPDYIQFAYRFSRLDEVTWFRIYLNPDAFINSYPRCTVTHIICPAKPKDLVNLSYDSVEIALTNTSRYVTDLITGEIEVTRDSDSTVDIVNGMPFGITQTYSDILKTANPTGACRLTTRYVPKYSTNTIATRYDFTFTCLFKGRRPTTSEMKSYVRDLLEAANGGNEVRDIFPDLYSSNNFILVPMYESRVITDTNSNVAYCSNIYRNYNMLLNYNGYLTCEEITDETLRKVGQMSANLNCPAYFMHILAYPEEYTDTSLLRFDEVSEFKSYQPINSTDVYWGTLSDEAREFNQMLTKIIAYQLTGYKPEGMTATEEVKTIFKIGSDGKYYPKSDTSHSGTDVTRTYLAFDVGAYNFAVMVRESYINNCYYILTTDSTFVADKTYYIRTGAGTAESPYVYTKAIVETGENIPADTYYERVQA